MELSTPIEEISNIGPVYRKRLKKLGIKTVEGLLFHFPHRYEDFSVITPISKLKQDQSCCVQGKILKIESSRTWKKRMSLTRAVAQDGTGTVEIIWFNRPYLAKTIKPGEVLSLAGKTSLGKDGLYISNPAHEKILNARDKRQAMNLTHTARIVPVYPETERLSSRWLRFIIRPLLSQLKSLVPDPLPEKTRKEFGLLPISRALWQIHFPDSMEKAREAQERFSFENLFLIELAVLRHRMKISNFRAPGIPLNLPVMQKMTKSLPFKLTDAQKKSAWQILKDLEKPRPMNRLLEGDVGSGKTVVAALAALSAVKARKQAAFMAPTEVLAKQHFKTVWELLQNFNLNLGLLTGKEDKFFSRKLKNDPIEISRKKLLEKTEEGEINILIGTHTLIQDQVKFKDLALVIVDEQHRFGVEQRAKLASKKEKGSVPHLLSMTATPIPRTLALTIYGDLDLSLIDELPEGRKKIVTEVVPPQKRKKTYGFIKQQIKKGRQAFVICPRIEAKKKGESEKASDWAGAKAVKEEYEKLSKKIFPDLRVEMMHGKLAGKEKERIMKDFKNKKADILVSTSVIEVGIDVPNATVMMIEGAERFGLAQLHQFRGRVGRAGWQSYCFLFTDSSSGKTSRRLEALVSCDDGFKLAEKDLKIRGPGDFMGVRQWGIPDLAMSGLKDIFLVEKTRRAAKELLETDPALEKYPDLKEKLSRFREKVHLE